ncbi:uncharacterized protein CTRU02_214871 [Colletotrichum truncatum]|uniref:Uncharacterized protein n=1 Tax=Colletotrichum truncatum TaxID=5467 RepID=A0ACC3YDW6_COLTU|nr:uncharacterized protein CTRU02_08374 [Colletotrichum truncatum]KAF6790245.1 hypothetical protein CTRU02_08374 [Colletotrichum truncatum]
MGEVSAEPGWVDADSLRTSFTMAMSNMYRSEVPLYGNLVRIVDEVNNSEIAQGLDPTVFAMRLGDLDASRIHLERHGAIRLGIPEELRTIRRVFALIGLHPVGYYDLSKAGLPMHATCFRPTTAQSLRKNPFRVFTSLLRLELLREESSRIIAGKLLSKRRIFSDKLLQLLDISDVQNGKLTPKQGDDFILEVMKAFSWSGTASCSKEDYEILKNEHPILADIACFQTAHINHLTPRTLDINAAQAKMEQQGMKVKDRIEGPPTRSCPILLRQTSFLAIEENIKFLGGEAVSDQVLDSGTHKARFGEIEERGAAVTRAGRVLYDQLFDEIVAFESKQAESLSQNAFHELVTQAFTKYPDNWRELRQRGLIYYTIQLTRKGEQAKLASPTVELETLLKDGLVEEFPITYEDFLPLSAAGIFQSNLDSGSPRYAAAEPDVQGMEAALGVSLLDSDALYERIQKDSITKCEIALETGIKTTR